MKLKCDKELLLEKISKALMFIPTKTLIPVLDNFLFKVSGTQLEIIANNTEMQVRIVTQVMESAHNGSFCIPAKMLVSTLKLLRNPEVTIEVKKKEAAVVCIIKSGNSKYVLSCDPSESFPEMVAPNAPYEATFDAKPFRDALQRAERTTRDADEFVRVELTGMEIAMKDHNSSDMFLTSTDCIKLSRHRVSPRAVGSWEPIVISTNVSEAIREMSNDRQVLDLMHDTKKLIVHGDWFFITAVLINGKFPETNQFFDDIPKDEIQLTTFEYRDALERLSIYCSKETGYVMEMQMNKDSLLMSTVDVGRNNEGHELLEINCQSPKVIAVNMKFMLTILSCIEQDSIRMLYSEPNKALYVYPNIEKPMEAYMLMPNFAGPVKTEKKKEA